MRLIERQHAPRASRDNDSDKGAKHGGKGSDEGDQSGSSDSQGK